jgi:uncharacterized protein YcbX
MTEVVSVSALAIYPIKSCGGIALNAAPIGPRGFVHDREWMVVTPDGEFLTQREIPRLALIQPHIEADGTLQVTTDWYDPLFLAPGTGTQRRAITVWQHQGWALDAGDEAAAWFSTVLEQPCRLVRFDPDEVRPVNPAYALTPEDQVGFADGYPFLLLSENSLDDLNQRLATPLPMNRFRPNIVVQGCPAFAEDTWREITIGTVPFGVVKPCARCAITTTDQRTALVGKEPLRTLATYRKGEHGVLFGQNLIHRATGTIQVGDVLAVMTMKRA